MLDFCNWRFDFVSGILIWEQFGLSRGAGGWIFSWGWRWRFLLYFCNWRIDFVSGILIWEQFGLSRGAGVGFSVGGGGGALYSIFAIGVLIL